MLNPNLDMTALAAEYASDQRIRITDVFDADFAARVAEHCEHHVPYDYLFHVDGQNKIAPADQFRSLSREHAQELNEKLIDAASRGIGFLYCGYMMSRAQLDTDDEHVRFLHSIFEYLNSEEMLTFISKVSGRIDIRSADGQFTRYQAGQYLTRHLDDVRAEQRRIAYVFSFCRDWHPDWGGLLQFFEEDGTPRDAWLPGFNTLSLFDVRHTHSVTYVTPFARRPRLSLTGWFRSSETDFNS